jgi:hypothetical protein
LLIGFALVVVVVVVLLLLLLLPGGRVVYAAVMEVRVLSLCANSNRV